MLEGKLITLVDEGTEFTVLAMKFNKDLTIYQQHKLQELGFGENPNEYTFCIKLSDKPATFTSDPFKQPKDGRTLKLGHLIIKKDYDLLEDGDTVDVREGI